MINHSMDNTIQVVIVLFILSMISERMASFVKLQYSEQTFLKFIKFGNLRIKTTNKNEEKNRELRILKINFFCGIMLAILLNANLLLILQHFDNPSDALGWGNFVAEIKGKGFLQVFKSVVLRIPGCILTGLFISLGSKFWHDLLDMLYETKELKGKLNDLKDSEINGVNELDSFYQQNELEIIRKEAESQLMRYQGVSFIEIPPDKKQVIVHGKDPNLKLPPQLCYRYGKIKTLPITTSNNQEEITTMSLSLGFGDEIANESPAGTNAGSLGCIVKKRQSGLEYILTCYHVVKNDGFDWELFNSGDGDKNVVHPLNGPDIVGEISQAIRNNFIDVALILPNKNVSVSNLHSNIGYIPNDPRVLTDDDVNNQTVVKMVGLKSGYREGYIADVHRQAYIKYIDGYHTLYDLIVIKSFDNRRFSQGGDSGSIIIDGLGYAIGLLVAGNNNISFAIPLNSVFNQLSIKF